MLTQNCSSTHTHTFLCAGLPSIRRLQEPYTACNSRNQVGDRHLAYTFSVQDRKSDTSDIPASVFATSNAPQTAPLAPVSLSPTVVLYGPCKSCPLTPPVTPFSTRLDGVLRAIKPHQECISAAIAVNLCANPF